MAAGRRVEMGRVRAFYINMDRDTDRLEHMQEQSRITGLEFCRVPAVAAAQLDLAQVAQYQPHQYRHSRWHLRPLEVAVFLSHRQAWEKIVESGDPFAIVMEDDLVFAPDFASKIASLVEGDVPFDLVRLCTFIQHRTIGPLCTVDSSTHLRRIIQEMGDAGCYLVSRQACLQLLAQSQAFCDHLDDFVFSPERGLRIYQLDPPLAGQVIHDMNLMAAWKAQGKLVSVREADDRRSKDKGPALYRLKKELKRALRELRLSVHRRFLSAQTISLADIKAPSADRSDQNLRQG